MWCNCVLFIYLIINKEGKIYINKREGFVGGEGMFKWNFLCCSEVCEKIKYEGIIIWDYKLI